MTSSRVALLSILGMLVTATAVYMVAQPRIPVGVAVAGTWIGEFARRQIPPVKVRVGDPVVVGGRKLPGVAAVVADMAPDFQRCYLESSADDPALKGMLLFTVQIAVNGFVGSVEDSGQSGLPVKLVSCATARIERAFFGPLEGGRATIVFTVSFVPEFLQ